MKETPDMNKVELLIKKSPTADLNIAKAYFAFRLVSQKTLGKFEGYFTQFNLRHSQVAIMLVIYVNDNIPYTSIEISKKLGLSTATISNVLNTLEKKGFIEKSKQKMDKRYYNVFLSDAGMDFLNSFIPDYLSYSEKLFSNFSEEEIKTLERLSLKLYSNLDSF